MRRAKRAGKPTLSKLKREADRVFSLYIRKRDGGSCVLCGSRNQMTCGHLFSRVASSTRWDENNAFAQCAGCNLRHEFQPDIFIRWYIKKFGLEKYEALAVKFHTIKKYNRQELETLIERYR